MAVLAQYMCLKGENESLADYLDNKVFAGMESITEAPAESDVAGFNAYIERYKRMLPAEKAAVESF